MATSTAGTTGRGGLPAVPRGLDQGLTLYLQALDGIVRRLTGMVRGSAAATVPAGAAATASSASVADASGIADFSVGEKQLQRGILTRWKEGTARDGEDIDLGAWKGRPVLCVTGFDVPAAGAGRLCVGLDDVRHDGTVWRCRARASGSGGTGTVRWAVIGKQA